jgi:hypothetical protein
MPKAAYSPAMESPIETPTRAGGRTVGLADELAHAAERLGHRGEPGTPRHRARLAVRRDPRDDELRVDPGQRRRVEAPPVERAGAEVLQQRVGAREQREDGVAALRLLEVQRDRALAAVDGAEQHRGVPGVQAPVAELVAGARSLDLDDLGAEVGEQAARRRRGDEVAELDDPQPGEGTVAVEVAHAGSPALPSSACTGLSSSFDNQPAVSTRAPRSTGVVRTPARVRR